MGADDVYEKLRSKISSWPIRVPKTKEVIEMLKILFNPEEAEFLSHFTAPYQDAETLDQIIEKTGGSEQKVGAIVDRLVSRGLLFKFRSERTGNVRYTLMPMIPGIFEFYFSSRPDPEEKAKVGDLFERFYMGGGGLEGGASNYPWARVIPVEKTITVNQEISKGHTILPFEELSKLMQTSRKIAVIQCACRTKKGCHHPLETCLVFDHYAEFMADRGFGRYLTIEEALNLLDQMEQSGLVHSTTNTQTRPQFICNCCTCSCLILRGLTELHNPRAIAKSNFIPHRDTELCNLCKKCVEICPMGANIYHAPHDREPEGIILLENRCIGCGLCAYHCPTGAIKLVKIRNETPEATPREAFTRVEAERIH